MGVKRWVIAGVGAVVLGLLGTVVSAATGSGPHRDSTTVVEIRNAELDRVNTLHANATPGWPAQFRLQDERDRVALSLSSQLEYLETVIANATPGWPAQFRAREEAESLREDLRKIGRG